MLTQQEWNYCGRRWFVSRSCRISQRVQYFCFVNSSLCFCFEIHSFCNLRDDAPLCLGWGVGRPLVLLLKTALEFASHCRCAGRPSCGSLYSSPVRPVHQAWIGFVCCTFRPISQNISSISPILSRIANMTCVMFSELRLRVCGQHILNVSPIPGYTALQECRYQCVTFSLILWCHLGCLVSHVPHFISLELERVVYVIPCPWGSVSVLLALHLQPLIPAALPAPKLLLTLPMCSRIT